MKHIPVSLIFCFHFVTSVAQYSGNYEQKAFFSPADSQKIFFSIAGSSFFKNNEYFNPIDQGYTLPGFRLQPSVTIQLSGDLRIQAGANFHKYWGREDFYRVTPVFRAQYQPVSWFQMIIGTLYDGSFHRLSEPLYRWERDFTETSGNGLQFLFNTQRIITDIWLSWDKFILHGDPFQEQLTVGNSTRLLLTNQNSGFELSLPIQTLFQHSGGQIDSANFPLETLANWATGVQLKKEFKGRYFRYLETEVLYVGYSDLSPQKLQQFTNGYGIYPKIRTGIANFSAEAGYFRGTRFISPMGERLLHSTTILSPGFSYIEKEVITGKVWFTKSIKEGISLSAYLETYTGLATQKTDYAYGVHIIFNQDFFLLKYRQ